MRFFTHTSSFASLLCALAVTTTALQPRQQDPGARLSDSIRGISTAVEALTASLQNYQGGILTFADPTAKLLAVHNANREAYAIGQETPRLSKSQSAQVVNVTNETVGKTIPAGIVVIKEKKPPIQDALLQGVVESSLVLLMYDHDSFSAVVGKKLHPSQVAGGALAAGKIAAAIQDAINFYALP